VTLGTLALRGLRFHWRSHLGVFLGAVLATAILVGALAVGDSVKYSLRRLALARLGEIRFSLNGHGRFFRAALADELSAELKAPAAPVMLLRATASTGDARSGKVQVVGVTDAFWGLAGMAPPLGSEEAVALNDRLARKLNVRAGDEVLLRVDKPSAVSRDAPLSTVEDSSVAIRLPVKAVLSDDQFGRFSLEANQVPPFNAFVPLGLLQREVEQKGRANALLLGEREGPPLTMSDIEAAFGRRWQLADASLVLRPLPKRNAVELRTDRVFLDPPVADAALKTVPGSTGVLTYFVNELRVGSRATPYSSVAAMQGGVVPDVMADDEILINAWLARDLQAKVGDPLKLSYYVVGGKRQLAVESSTFRIRAILPMEGAAVDRELMPDYPGLAQAENCRDWEPGIPVDLDRIRPVDEAYWDAYRGTPKAFVTLSAGQRMWNNRFGNLTAVRYPAKDGTERISAALRDAVTPASLGLFFQPVREQAIAAAGTQTVPFGLLFLGFSFFLIVAALLLTALLFAFGVEQRAEETGILLATGFPPKRVQRLLLLEGALIALVAGLLGAGAGLLYTQAVVRGLSTIWSGAVAAATLLYHAEPGTVAMGALAGFFTALLAIWLVVRKQARAPARELLAAGTESETALFAPAPRGKRPGVPTALVSGGLALALIIWGFVGDRHQAAMFFFIAGALLLISGIAACRALLAQWERGAASSELTVASLGLRNSVRRRGRSLVVVGLLACGSFLVFSIGASRHDPHEGAHERSSGTGGFALYGESSLPIYQDLNTPEGLEPFGLEKEDLRDASVVQMRLREGDEASCLNLNRAQAPRLLGITPGAFWDRGAFTFAQTTREAAKNPWNALETPQPDGAVPAIADANTVEWALGKKLGDTIPYTDDRGQPFQLRIVGIMANGVLQGSLLISEANLIQRFPSVSGYQVFLIDAPAGRVPELTQTLTKATEDIGLDLTPTADRLAAFNEVENTYLSIFAVLGGLGLLLGSIGLGVVVLRHVLERRGELALLRAVGFRGRALQWLVFSEHSLLLALGLGVGILSALIAVIPALRNPDVPYGTLALTLGAVLVSGLVWTWAATALALRSPLLSALRNE
jgi:putative ABC transport system permease protein